MRVSVVVPTYNRADLVGEAVSSVLRQSFSDLELVIVDDGSTDDTPTVLAQLSDPRVRVITQANQGISGAVNTGFGAARGEYVIRLDSDDRFLPHCLARLVADADAQPDAVLAYGRAQAIDRAGRPLAMVTGNAEPFPGRTLFSILYGDFIAPSTVLIRRRALDTPPFDPALRGNEDWDLWIRLAWKGRFVFVDEILAQFRIHAGRFTAPRRDRLAALAEGRVHILDKAFARRDLPADVRAARALIYRNVYVDIGVRWLNTGGYREALTAFRRALGYGGSRRATLTRIAYLSVFHRLVQRFAWVQWLSDTIFRSRRRRRASREARA